MLHVSSIVAVFAALIAAPAVQVALAVDGPPVDQPGQVKTDVYSEPGVRVETRVETGVPADRDVRVQTVVPENGAVVTESDRMVTRTDRVVVHDSDAVKKLPDGSVVAIEKTFPGAVIVDADRVPMRDAWDVTVVGQDGKIYSARVDKSASVVSHKLDQRHTDELAKLPENVKNAVKSRYPDAVMYNSERTVEDGKRAYEVEIITQGMRKDVKVSRHGEILEVESDADDVGHDPDTRSSD